MYIEPNTNIRILKNCPLDPTYDHTLWWNSRAQQTAYFQSITKYNLTRQSYQRVQKGTSRVAVQAENLYDCNYIMFQNSAFGDKWFYAFIKGVEYYNNGMSEITFELDVLQTWFFDYQLDQCFVEREHSVTDVIGENTIAENVEQGPYIVKDYGAISPETTGRYICVITTIPQPTTAVYDHIEPGIIDGVYNPYYYVFYPLTKANADGLTLYLEQLVQQNKGDAVVAILMTPFSKSTTSVLRTDVELDKQHGPLDGYTPKNKKLLTYPFNVLHLCNDVGSMDLRYELFNGEKCTLSISQVLGPDASMTIMPSDYAGMNVLDLERQIVSAGYPMCAWVNDTWSRYFAENRNSITWGYLSSALQGVLGFVGGVATGNPLVAGGSLVSSVSTIGSMIMRQEDIKTKPPEVNGNVASSAQYALGQKNFIYKKLTIRAEYAKIIDDYFTMFGYATHRVKVPNRNSRPHWNYVKTVGCVLVGSIPADDVTAICNIYNRGVTFWKNASEIGNYNLDNSPA